MSSVFLENEMQGSDHDDGGERAIVEESDDEGVRRLH